MSTEPTKPESRSPDEPAASETQPAPRGGGTRLILPIVLIGIPVVVFAFQGLSSLSKKETGPGAGTRIADSPRECDAVNDVGTQGER